MKHIPTPRDLFNPPPQASPIYNGDAIWIDQLRERLYLFDTENETPEDWRTLVVGTFRILSHHDERIVRVERIVGVE
jgi:hypothetical protein